MIIIYNFRSRHKYNSNENQKSKTKGVEKIHNSQSNEKIAHLVSVF